GAIPSLGRALGGDPRPLQVLLYARRRARASVARIVGGADVVHAQLVRSLAYVPATPPPAVVVDLVDALSMNFSRRARHAHGPLAALAGWEAARLARCEGALVR